MAVFANADFLDGVVAGTLVQVFRTKSFHVVMYLGTIRPALFIENRA